MQFLNGVDKEQLSWWNLLPPETEMVNKKNLEWFFELMVERQNIWWRRFILKQPAPWTNNEIYKQYKFENVYRELDRASQWLIKNVLLDKTLSDEDLLFRIICFRFFNEPNTFEFIKLPHYDTFNSKDFYDQVVWYREKHGNPFHTAYMMNMAFFRENFKPEKGLMKDYAYSVYLMERVHKKIPELLSVIKKAKEPETVIEFLETFPAVSNFQSHEFFIDFCYIKKYNDRDLFPFTEMDYTNVGPGASLGIRLIFPSLKGHEQKQAIYNLQKLSKGYLKGFKYLKWDSKKEEYVVSDRGEINLHQIEFQLCGFQKYWKMTLGLGKQRSKFKVKTKI